MKNKEPFYTTLIGNETKPNFAFLGSDTSINEGFSLMCIGGSSQAFVDTNHSIFSLKYNLITTFTIKCVFCGIEDKIQNQGRLILSISYTKLIQHI